jgi:hypothetical protein
MELVSLTHSTRVRTAAQQWRWFARDAPAISAAVWVWRYRRDSGRLQRPTSARVRPDLQRSCGLVTTFDPVTELELEVAKERFRVRIVRLAVASVVVDLVAAVLAYTAERGATS